VIAVFRHHVSVYALLAVFSDILLAFLGVVLAAWTVGALGAHGSGGLPTAREVFQIAVAFAVLTSLTWACFGIYRKSSPRSASSRFLRTFVALPLVGYLTYLALRLIIDNEYAALLIGVAIAYLTAGLLLARVGAQYLRRWSNPTRVLVVGNGPEAQALAQEIKGQSRGGCRVIGFYPTSDTSGPGLDSLRTVLPRDAKLVDLVAQHDVDEVIVAVGDHRGGAVPMDQLLACRTRGVRVLDLAAFFERTRSEVPIDSLKASWLVYGQGFVQGRWRRAVKRVFDIVGSGLLLAVSLPVLLVAMILVTLDSPGPVLYRQERVGRRGRTFMCLKLRSMRTDAESDGIERWASTDDPRVTRVGRFIRKTRIDELPQLISVLRGEMSLVGPRPERPSFVRDLNEQIPFYDVRHSIKPGLTGWAQVRYCYGASVEDARRKHQFDLYYVKNNSLFLDLLILIETVSVVLLREGQ
jgi:sugar transferase (PEP-CTERM system associated)